MYCRDCHYCLYRLGEVSVCPECGRGFDVGDIGSYFPVEPRLSVGKLLHSRRVIGWCVWVHLALVFVVTCCLMLTVLREDYFQVGTRYFILGMSLLSFVLMILAMGMLIRVKSRGFELRGWMQRYVAIGVLVAFVVVVSCMDFLG